MHNKDFCTRKLTRSTKQCTMLIMAGKGPQEKNRRKQHIHHLFVLRDGQKVLYWDEQILWKKRKMAESTNSNIEIHGLQTQKA